MQQGIKKLQWFEYLNVVFLEILNLLSCWAFANQVIYVVVSLKENNYTTVLVLHVYACITVVLYTSLNNQ